MVIFSRRKPASIATLHDYQVPHADHLAEVILKHGAALDMSDTGTGKGYVAMYVAKKLNRRILAIGPKTSIGKYLNIACEMRSGFFGSCGWEEAKTKNFPYNILKFENRSRSGERTLESVKWKIPDDVLLWFDEGHRGKGDDTQNSMLMQAAQGIPTLTSSATLAASAKDMLATGRLLRLHHDRESFNEFCRTFGWDKKLKEEELKLAKEEALTRLHGLILPEYGGRLRTKDIPGFPKNNLFAELITVEHPEKMSDWRADLLRQVASLQSNGKNAQAFTARLRYRQAAELERLPAMIEKARDAEEEGNSVAIFVNFRPTLFAAMELLQRDAVAIYGQQNPKARAEALQRFQNNEAHFLICTHDAGGTSEDMHDLKGRPRVSMISPPESGFQLKQTIGRICRDGALSKAMQYVFYMAGVEEDVYHSVKGSFASIDALNDGEFQL